MTTVFSFLLTSLDGRYEGPDGALDWFNLTPDFHDHSRRQLRQVGTLVFGRDTYEHMAAAWQTPDPKADPEVAERMNALPKVVCSRTLDEVGWGPATLVRDGAAAIADVKGRGGGDVAILGSAALTADLLDAGVVDEVRIMVAPMLLGEGPSLYPGLRRRVALDLVRTTAFAGGNVLLCYRPTRA